MSRIGILICMIQRARKSNFFWEIKILGILDAPRRRDLGWMTFWAMAGSILLGICTPELRNTVGGVIELMQGLVARGGGRITTS